MSSHATAANQATPVRTCVAGRQYDTFLVEFDQTPEVNDVLAGLIGRVIAINNFSSFSIVSINVCAL